MGRHHFVGGGRIVAIAAISMAIAAPPAPAQSPEPGASGNRSSVMDRIREKMRKMDKPETETDRWFNNLDIDKNNEITKNELFESLRQRFSSLDTDKDGFVSKSEYLSARSAGALGESRFGALDSNKDGRLTMTEFASPADWRFDRIDRNLDGKISRTEAARVFDRPRGQGSVRDSAKCFYIDRQIIRVDAETAEKYEKLGYRKADCEWVPDSTELDKTKKSLK